ncbi:hypothetical protein [Desulfohalovibrio reitneri]|uniref:hypothetical protein n=1 Tax=Desulfohalovibrio reitneri TaxID=1307759 RepID=UPI0004A732E8|nr:hypothetical protein [Desulfohalovibrio reitneri]
MDQTHQSAPNHENLHVRKAAEERASACLCTKCFLGCAFVGALAGALPIWAAEGYWRVMLFNAILGTILVLVSGFLGGLGGMLLRGAALYLKGDRTVEPTNSEGIVLGAFGGSFIGLVAQLMAWDLGGIPAWAAIGSMAGALLGALPGEHIALVVRVMTLEEERRKKKDEP